MDLNLIGSFCLSQTLIWCAHARARANYVYFQTTETAEQKLTFSFTRAFD